MRKMRIVPIIIREGQSIEDDKGQKVKLACPRCLRADHMEEDCRHGPTADNFLKKYTKVYI